MGLELLIIMLFSFIEARLAALYISARLHKLENDKKYSFMTLREGEGLCDGTLYGTLMPIVIAMGLASVLMISAQFGMKYHIGLMVLCFITCIFIDTRYINNEYGNLNKILYYTDKLVNDIKTLSDDIVEIEKKADIKEKEHLNEKQIYLDYLRHNIYTFLDGSTFIVRCNDNNRVKFDSHIRPGTSVSERIAHHKKAVWNDYFMLYNEYYNLFLEVHGNSP